ncbi:PAS domain S-box-containing protein [Natronorubrum texcoconense]|uniref:histidine kinase n=2 Tax=Natronorubrum texcoconense TaxID=1095776 RepID=A0A1G9B6I9_9EURY|nr:PAS domain S-box-containing protein [Natronorubrum texcoconense]
MAIPSSCRGSFVCLTGREIRLLALGLLSLAFGALIGLLVVVSSSVGPTASMDPSPIAEPTPGIPVVLPLLFGLAASGDPDRDTALERLATDLESFVAEFTADSSLPASSRDGRGGDGTSRNGAAADATERDETDPDTPVPDEPTAKAPAPNDRAADASARVDTSRVREAEPTFDLERDDELGRLSAAIETLATTVRERDRQFEAVFDDPKTLVALLDPNGTVRRINETALEYLDSDREEAIGEPFPAMSWWADTPTGDVQAWIDRAESGVYVEYEAQLNDPDGNRRWVSGTFRPVTNEAGEVASIVVSGRDDTARKEREQRLEAANARLETLFESAPDMIDVLDADGRIVDANRRLRTELGYEEGELLGTGIWTYDKLVDEADVESILEELSVGDRRTFEGRYLRRDGSEFPVEIQLLHLDLPEANRFVAISRDITEQKARERELQRHTAYTDELLDAVDDVFYVIDGNGEIQRWNETLSSVTGFSTAEIESMNAAEFFSPADQRLVADAIDEALETGSARVEVSLLTADGESIPYEFIGARLEDLDGNAVVTGIGRDISERKERERQLSTLMSNVPGMVYRCRNEPDWPFDFVSEGCFELTGYDPEMLENDDVNWASDIILERHGELWETVQQAVANREPFQVTFPIETADGDRRWVRERGRGVFDENGELESLEGVITDVTEQIENGRRLERTTRLLEQSQRLANIGAWELDATEEPYDLEWTDQVSRIHGLPPSEAVDVERALEFYHPADRPTVRSALERAIEDGEPYDLQVRLQSDDGDQRWVRTIGDPVEADGTIVKVRGAFQEITDRKRRERELERYETIIQAVGDPVYTLDESGEFQFVNDAMESLTGYEPEQMLEWDVADVMTSADLEAARELVRDLLREGEPYGTFEMGLVTADGDVIEAENHVALLPMDDGEFAGTAGVVRDITERKERERELERTTDLLERVQRMAKVGGWELDVDAEPPAATWTDECYRLHGLSRDVTPTLETTLESYHPDDRPFVRTRLRNAMDAERGYDFEARLQPDEDESRWVRATGEPIFDAAGDLRAYRGSIKDISEQKRRELTLESLHETARDLLNAETETAIAELVVETAADILEPGSAGVYLLDSGTNRFEPTAFTDEFADRTDGAPSITVGDNDSVLWNTYLAGSQTVVDDAATSDRSPLFGGDVPGGLLVPIGDHGVFVLVTPPATIDDEARRLVETLVATTEAAFDRLESEASLRERDAELEAQNRRLRRQIQITEIIRGIDRSLIGANSREEIEQTVPERLVEGDTVAFAWIGDVDAAGRTLEPRSWAGAEPEYLDAVSFDLETDADEPSVRTVGSGTPSVVENVVEGLKDEPWRTSALDAGFQSVLSVPLSFEEYSYGVLTVYADEPDAFTDLERTVFAELGEGIANATNAAKTQEALHAETLVELTLALEGSDDALSQIARKTGATVEYEGLGVDSGSETVLFFETNGVAPDDVRTVLDELVSVTDARLVTESDEQCLFEATVTSDVVASRLVRHGASPRSITADGDRTMITVDVPTTTDVREFVEMLAERHAGVELQSRRHVRRSSTTRQLSSLFDELTDRQLEVLRTAYLAGFFEWPRESTGEEIAEMLEVTQPTVNRHLRIGQQRLLAQLFENGALSFADEA